MLKDSIVLKVANNILKRFEKNYREGTLFLYNLDNAELWSGNASTVMLFDLIDSSKTLQEIYEIMIPSFEDYSPNQVKESLKVIIKELIEKNFLEVT